ncbi:MAG: ABC transporter substrate-binding protein [Synergistota bacterium]|nr:ABC transporter substrate-binding protein [Synergistota bacterium]
MRRSFALKFFMCFLFVFGVFMSPAFAVQEIKVGVVYPRTGALARLGETTIQGILLAIDDVNKAGGIKSMGGAKLVPVVVDAKDATTTRSETERLISREKVKALFGCYSSSYTMVATEVSERAKVPFFTNSIADDILGRGYKYVYRMAVPASIFGRTPIDALIEMSKGTKEQLKKVAIIYEDTSYGTSTSEGFKNRAIEKGLDVVLFESYRAGITDAGPIVSKIKASGAQVVFPVSYLTDAILIIRTMKETDTNAAIMGGGSGYIMPDTIKIMGKDLDYIFSTACWNHDLPYEEAKKVNDNFKKLHGEYIQETAGELYAAVWVLKDALERCGTTDGPKLREAISTSDIKKGPATIMQPGRVRFDAKGQLIDIFPLLVQWQKGELKTVWPNQAATGKPAWPVPNWTDRK